MFPFLTKSFFSSKTSDRNSQLFKSTINHVSRHLSVITATGQGMKDKTSTHHHVTYLSEQVWVGAMTGRHYS